MSIRAVFFRMMMRAQNINPIAHPGMKDKMKQMSAKYSHTKPKKGYTLECLTTANGTKYQRLIRDRAKPSDKVIYYIHGGCYISGLTYNYRDFCAPFCDLSDGLTESRSIRSDNIILGGDSSGGNLALALMLWLRDMGKSLPKSLFLLSPWTDMTISGKSYAENYNKDVEIGDKNGVFNEQTKQALLSSYLYDYIGDNDRTDPYISPAFADYKGFPPMLLFAGEDEMLLDDTLTVCKRAREAGVDVILETQPKMFHSYVLYTNYMPESKSSYRLLKDFIKNSFSL